MLRGQAGRLAVSREAGGNWGLPGPLSLGPFPQSHWMCDLSGRLQEGATGLPAKHVLKYYPE